MPMYVYEVVRSDGQRGETFEILQGIHDAPLTVHPQTGEPVRRSITAPFIAGTWSDLQAKASLSDKSLEAKGFTKYVRAGDGVYEKRAGAGPDTISNR